MIRKVIIGLLLLVMVQGLLAGGILTNTNQSLQFTRMLARNASVEIDAVYFNPAGITMLKNGFHLALHNQVITQGRTVTSSFPYLNNKEYQGDTFVPLFPNLYAVYRKDNMAFAFGFAPIAGGGTADFKKGLPDFENAISLLPLKISAAGVPTTAYSADLAFKGSSIYYGIQLSGAYAINEMFSVSLGARYNLASNTYEGSLGNILVNPTHPALNPTGAMIPASTFFTAIGDNATAAAVSNQEVDAKQSGSGITPFIGINIKPMDNLNIGLKYELATQLELENETEKDLIASPQFPDGQKERNDIPAIFAGGLSYQLTDALLVALGGNYYFDKNANWEGKEKLLDSNSWEFQAGVQYRLSDLLLLSAGYQRSTYGVTKEYQSGLKFDLSANAIGAGARVSLMDGLALELGGIYTMYESFDGDYLYTIAPGVNVPYKVTYEKTAWVVAFGLEYSLGR